MKPEKENLSDILDKMLELRRTEKCYTWMQKAMTVFCGIAAIIVISFLCVMMYKNNFSIESLLSLLLAFFSIFISVFFYFKASDTSNDFYDKSYNIMKEVSVTLGKIDAQFGEKLNNMNEKLGHLSHAEAEKTEELESVEDEKQTMINELLEKAKYSEEEKERFIKQLQRKDNEVNLLKRELSHLSREQMMLWQKSNDLNELNYSEKINKLFSMCDESELIAILEGNISRLSRKTRMMLSDIGITPKELLNSNEFRALMEKKMQNISAYQAMEENDNSRLHYAKKAQG